MSYLVVLLISIISGIFNYPRLRRIYEEILTRLAAFPPAMDPAELHRRARPRQRLIFALIILGIATCSSPFLYLVHKIPEDTEYFETYAVTYRGINASAEDAMNLEIRLEDRPDDRILRLQLLGYTWKHRDDSEFLRRKHAEHTLWLIRNLPRHRICQTLAVELDPNLDTDAYGEAAALWEQHAKDAPKDIRILENAATFFFITEPSRAAEYLRRGLELEPENEDWKDWLKDLSLPEENSVPTPMPPCPPEPTDDAVSH